MVVACRSRSVFRGEGCDRCVGNGLGQTPIFVSARSGQAPSLSQGTLSHVISDACASSVEPMLLMLFAMYDPIRNLFLACLKKKLRTQRGRMSFCKPVSSHGRRNTRSSSRGTPWEMIAWCIALTCSVCQSVYATTSYGDTGGNWHVSASRT